MNQNVVVTIYGLSLQYPVSMNLRNLRVYDSSVVGQVLVTVHGLSWAFYGLSLSQSQSQAFMNFSLHH